MLSYHHGRQYSHEGTLGRGETELRHIGEILFGPVSSDRETGISEYISVRAYGNDYHGQ